MDNADIMQMSHSVFPGNQCWLHSLFRLEFPRIGLGRCMQMRRLPEVKRPIRHKTLDNPDMIGWVGFFNQQRRRGPRPATTHTPTRTESKKKRINRFQVEFEAWRWSWHEMLIGRTAGRRWRSGESATGTQLFRTDEWPERSAVRWVLWWSSRLQAWKPPSPENHPLQSASSHTHTHTPSGTGFSHGIDGVGGVVRRLAGCWTPFFLISGFDNPIKGGGALECRRWSGCWTLWGWVPPGPVRVLQPNSRLPISPFYWLLAHFGILPTGWLFLREMTSIN